MNYYSHHIGDYLSATVHLTALEDCFYRRALDWYYTNEKPMPLDSVSVCRLLRAQSTEERSAVESILNEFFTRQEDGWHNKRADEELSKYKKRVDANHENGRKGGRPRAETQKTQSVSNGFISDNPNGTQVKGNQEPRTNNQEPITKPPKPPRASRSAGPAFDAFWLAYPRKAAKPKALAAWAKINPDDQTTAAIMSGLQAAKASPDWNRDGGQYIPHPTTWLNGRRWEDSAPQPIPQVHPLELPKGHPVRVAYETRGI